MVLIVEDTVATSSVMAMVNAVPFVPHGQVLTDARENIIFANDQFIKFTGYSRSEMIGVKCNFLQGEHTDPGDIEDIRKACQAKQPCCVIILNYRKDGSPFWNILSIRPLFHFQKGQLTHFLGDIISLPAVPQSKGSMPKLCVDDALALLKMFSTIPSGVCSAMIEDAHSKENGRDRQGSEASDSDHEDPTFDSTVAQDVTSETSDLPTVHTRGTRRRRSSTTSTHISSEGEKFLITTTTAGKEDNRTDNNAAKTAQTNELNFEKIHVSTVRRSRFQNHVKWQRANSPNAPVHDAPLQGDTAYTDTSTGVMFPKSSVVSLEERFEFVAETCLPTDKGRFRMRAYRELATGAEPIAMVHGDVEDQSNVTVRVHDQCVTSEVFGSLRCDCKQQLDHALKYIKDNGTGMVIYMPQEGRGIGLANKVAAYSLQEQGLDTVDANRKLGLPDDARQYDAVKFILDNLRISSIELLTNNPRKIICLEKLGVKINLRKPCVVDAAALSSHSLGYLQSKVERMGHIINSDSIPTPQDGTKIRVHQSAS